MDAAPASCGCTSHKRGGKHGASIGICFHSTACSHLPCITVFSFLSFLLMKSSIPPKDPIHMEYFTFVFLKRVLAHQWKLCLIQKSLGTSTTSTTTGRKDQRQEGCSVLPVGVVSEYIACCALCGWNFFFVSQRTACLIIKALSIAWYNFDSVSLQLSAQYNYVFKKQSYSSC